MTDEETEIFLHHWKVSNSQRVAKKIKRGNNVNAQKLKDGLDEISTATYSREVVRPNFLLPRLLFGVNELSTHNNYSHTLRMLNKTKQDMNKTQQ